MELINLKNFLFLFLTDDSVYEVPHDDYGYWNLDESNASEENRFRYCKLGSSEQSECNK